MRIKQESDLLTALSEVVKAANDTLRLAASNPDKFSFGSTSISDASSAQEKALDGINKILNQI
jgi:hypothetical protein